MAAFLTNHLWPIAELVNLLEAREDTATDVGRRRKDRQH